MRLTARPSGEFDICGGGDVAPSVTSNLSLDAIEALIAARETPLVGDAALSGEGQHVAGCRSLRTGSSNEGDGASGVSPTGQPTIAVLGDPPDARKAVSRGVGGPWHCRPPARNDAARDGICICIGPAGTPSHPSSTPALMPALRVGLTPGPVAASLIALPPPGCGQGRRPNFPARSAAPIFALDGATLGPALALSYF